MYQDDPLSRFYNAAINQQPPQKNLVDVDFGTLDPGVFENSLQNIGTMDDNTLTMFIIHNINRIADDVICNNANYSYLFKDSRFISCFIRAISSIQISYEVKIASNKLAYDYFTSDKPDSAIKKQYLNLAQIVNRLEIARLIGLGLDENSALNFALCRYSSNNEVTNIKRLNFSIYHRNPEVMTEQMIVWIYEKFFTSISQLFHAVMFEVYSDEEMDSFEQRIGDGFSEVYGTVGLAVLRILTNMPSELIRKVLLGYIEAWEANNFPPVRFGLRSLNSDYSRVVAVAEYLTSIGKVVP